MLNMLFAFILMLSISAQPHLHATPSPTTSPTATTTPTSSPTSAPSVALTSLPTEPKTLAPSSYPTSAPTPSPSSKPSATPEEIKESKETTQSSILPFALGLGSVVLLSVGYVLKKSKGKTEDIVEGGCSIDSGNQSVLVMRQRDNAVINEVVAELPAPVPRL